MLTRKIAGFAGALMLVSTAAAATDGKITMPKTWDTNQDGRISADEWSTGSANHASFDAWDSNSDGMVDRTEFYQGVWMKYDANQDGAMDADEQKRFSADDEFNFPGNSKNRRGS